MQLEHNIRYEAHYSIIVEAIDHRLCIGVLIPITDLNI